MYASGTKRESASRARPTEPRLCPMRVKCGYVESSTSLRRVRKTKCRVAGERVMEKRDSIFSRIELFVADVSPV
jgi:hypothetical protein